MAVRRHPAGVDAGVAKRHHHHLRLVSRRNGISHSGKAADLVVMRASRPVTTVEQAFGQVVWMGEASRLESVLVDGQEMLARGKTQPDGSTAQ